MKKLLIFSIFGLTICLLKSIRRNKNLLDESPKFHTVGEENRLSFNDWCKHTNVSRQYAPEPDLAKLSTVINLKP